jgi:class 3 adenylate cyclase
MSLTMQNSDLIIGNIVLSACINTPLIVTGIDKIPIIWSLIIGINIYILLNTIYQVVIRQKHFSIRGLLFVIMHIVKAIYVVIGYILLNRLNLNNQHYSFPPLSHVHINPLNLHLIINSASLMINFLYSIISIFAQNSRLYSIAQNLKRICSWSLDENILANKILQNKQDLIQQNRAIVFGDIRGFTEFSSNHPNKIIAIALQEFYQTVDVVTQQFAGSKPEFIADEFITFFSTSQQAVEYALELRNQLQTNLSQYNLMIGIGIHEGPVLEGIFGSESSKKYSIMGHNVNIASRLESAAKGNEILCSTKVASQIANIKINSTRKIHLKGIKGKFEVCSLEKESETFIKKQPSTIKRKLKLIPDFVRRIF